MAASSFLSSPVAGIIADELGNRQQPFLAGLVALLLSTILLAMSDSVGMVALARILQGMSSSVVWVIGFAICLETVGQEKLGTTIGMIFSCVTVGTLVAPVLGGVLYTKTGYTGVFALCLSLIVVDITLRLLMVEKKTACRYRKGLETLAVSKQNDQTSLDENSPLLSRSAQPTQGEDYGLYALNAPSTWLTKNMPILCTFRSPAFLTAFCIGFVKAFLIGSLHATLPMVALGYYGFNYLHSGLLFLALGIPSLLLGPVFGWAVDRYGTRLVAVLGYGYLVPVHILLMRVQPGGVDQVREFAVILAAVSVGITATNAPSLVGASVVVEKYHKANPDLFGETGPYAQLYGITNMVYSAGVTIGPVLAGTLKETVGYGNMNAVLAAICLTSAVLSWLNLGTAPNRKAAGERDSVA